MSWYAICFCFVHIEFYNNLSDDWTKSASFQTILLQLFYYPIKNISRSFSILLISMAPRGE